MHVDKSGCNRLMIGFPPQVLISAVGLRVWTVTGSLLCTLVAPSTGRNHQWVQVTSGSSRCADEPSFSKQLV